MSRILEFCSTVSIHHHDTQYEGCIAYRVFWKTQYTFFLLALLAWSVSSCSEQTVPYRPPTTVFQAARPAQITTAPAATSPINVTALPISTPTCTDNLAFLEDLSLPDGSVVKPGAILDKRWLVENSGTCNWDQDYRLKFMSGIELDAPLDQSLYPARSGSQATIRIIFTAPSDPGTYQSAWQAYNPQGQPFGDPVFLQVTVGSEEP